MEKLELSTDIEVCQKIAKRAITKIDTLKRSGLDELDIMMYVCYCNKKTPLDLEKLLNFDEFNFAHDIVGIINHLDHTTFELTKCFLPRCTK
jgi:hypothetical protein